MSKNIVDVSAFCILEMLLKFTIMFSYACILHLNLYLSETYI